MKKKMLVAAALSAIAVPAITVGLASPASAAPPTPPSESVSRSHLAAIPTKAEGSGSGYSRDLFPHWITIEGNCNTRETVLKRDGTGVTTGPNCAPTSGSWYSPYDGATWTDPADVDIDHLVPLAEAWRSGANTWSSSKRRSFANDLSRAQLWAVTDNVNQSKGDRDPADWRPPNEEVHCEYARAWIDVKHHWKLTVDKAEKAALAEMLDTC